MVAWSVRADTGGGRGVCVGSGLVDLYLRGALVGKLFTVSRN